MEGSLDYHMLFNYHIVYNKVTNLLKAIRHIDFTELKELKIRGNEICSVEGIHHIQWPNLQSLWVDDNFIINISQLSKFPFSQLKVLYISTTLIM